MKTLRSATFFLMFLCFFFTWPVLARSESMWLIKVLPGVETYCASFTLGTTPHCPNEWCEYPSCSIMGPGVSKVITPPVHGTLRIAIENRIFDNNSVYGLNCDIQPVPTNVIYYTWNDDASDATQDYFVLDYCNYSGYYDNSCLSDHYKLDFTVYIDKPSPTPTPTPFPCDPDWCAYTGGTCIDDVCVPNSTPSPEQNLGYETSSGTPSINCFDPVNIATGNNLQTETDFVGASNTFLELKRTYNSQSTASSAFGANWNGTWQRSIAQPNSTTVKATRADGGVFTFTLTAGVWQSGPNVTSKLSAVLDSNNQQIGWQLVTADDSIEYYWLDGRFAYFVTRAGLVTTINYDFNKKLSSVVGPFGRTLNFTYDGSNRVNQATAPDGGVYLYKYDGNNNLSSVTYPENVVRQYLYENTSFPHAMTGIIDENGNRFATFTYDAQGRTVSTAHAGGAEQVTITYNANGTSTMTDANGNSSIATFTTQFGMVKPAAVDNKGCSCGSSAYTYDANGFLASRKDFNGNLTTYSRNARGLELSRTEASGTPQARTITTTWHSTFHLPTSITDPNRVTTFAYDAKGNMLQKTVKTSKNTRTWKYTYNNSGQVLTVDAPRTDVQDVTTFTYDSKGDIATITNALGHITSITSYDANGRPLTVQDPNGLVSTLGYDARGRLTSRNSGGEVTTYSYDAAGELNKITKPDGSYTTLGYDAAHRLTDIADALGNHIHYTLDAVGNRIKEDVFDTNNKLTQTRSYAYDQLNRLSQNIGAQNQTTIYGYDNNSNLTSITDPLGNTTTYTYDTLNRIAQTTDPNKGTIKTNHDPNDMITSVTDPRGLVTNYANDELNDITLIQSPDSGTTTKTYDEAGNVASTIDARSNTITYTYDALNRITKKSSSDGKSVVFNYDQLTNGIGHLTSMTDESGTTTWTYDIYGHVIQKQQQTGSAMLTTSTTYSSGNIASITYPSGRKLTYNYAAFSGKIAEIDVDGKPFLSSILYQPFGSAWLWYYGNGSLFAGRLFDLDGNIYLYGHNNQQGTIEYATLTRDKAGRITNIANSTSSENKIFGYDALNRLTSYANGTQTQNYGYDSNGNRMSLDTNTDTIDYLYASTSNRLLNHSGATPQSYSYDAAGNLTSDGVFTYAYDADGHLVQVSKGIVSTVTPTPMVDNNDGTISISATGLMWQKVTAGKMTVADALSYCNQLSLAGYTDWRLPNKDELYGLIDQTRCNPSININYFPDTMSSWYWSSSTWPNNGNPIAINFDYPCGSDGDGSQPSWYIRAVRTLTSTPTPTPIPAPSPTPTPISIQYQYNGLGQRVAKLGTSVSTGANIFSYDPVGNLLGEYDASGNVFIETIWLEGMPVGRLVTGAQFNIIPDHLGAPYAITDTNGNTGWTWDHDPFGNGAAPVYNLRFPGQYFDTETGLHYNMARTYDPVTGRYIQSDPIGLAGGINTYAYVGNNPVVGVDPLGLYNYHEDLKIFAEAMGIIGTGAALSITAGAAIATAPAVLTIATLGIAATVLDLAIYPSEHPNSDAVAESLKIVVSSRLPEGTNLITDPMIDHLAEVVPRNFEIANDIILPALSIMGKQLADKYSHNKLNDDPSKNICYQSGGAGGRW